MIAVTLTTMLGSAVSALAQTAPRFTSITAGSEGSISLTLTGAVLTSYTILATTDLNATFSPVGVIVTDENGTGSFTDAGTTAINRQRFYRAQQTASNSARTKQTGGSTPQPTTTAVNRGTQPLRQLQSGSR